MPTVGLAFFQARAYQHNTSIFFAQDMILQDGHKFKSTYVAKFNSPRKILQTVDFIFLSNSTLQDECNKIWFTPFEYS